MSAIKFPTSSQPGERPALGQGRLVNAYAVKEGDRVLWKRVPGLTTLLDTGEEKPRGMLWFREPQNLIYVAGSKVGKIDTSSQITWLNNDIDGAGAVSMARNNNATPDIVIVTNTNTWVATSAAVGPYPDGNISVPNSVSFLDGYFLFTYPNGEIRATNLNTTEIDPLSNTKAESNPDGLLRGIVSAQLFYAMGTSSIEVFQDVGETPFPLARVAVMQVGLFGPWAVAGGQQEGWDQSLIFVARDGTVRKIVGYQDQTISNADVVRDILSITDRSSLIASVYVVGDSAFWSLSSPDWTWEYNATTGAWHQRKSYQLSRWRAAYSALAFDKWIVADTQSTKLYEVSRTRQSEDGSPLVFEVESAPVTAFPARLQCRRADFDFVVGYGQERGLDPIEIEPVVSIEWSDDGGVSWRVPILRQLGREGRYSNLVSLLNTGMTGPQGRKWRLKVSDPIDCTLKGGQMFESARVV